MQEAPNPGVRAAESLPILGANLEDLGGQVSEHPLHHTADGMNREGDASLAEQLEPLDDRCANVWVFGLGAY